MASMAKYEVTLSSFHAFDQPLVDAIVTGHVGGHDL